MGIGRENNSNPMSKRIDQEGSTQKPANTREDGVILNKFLKVVQQKFTATAASSSPSDPGDRQRRLERIDEMYKSPAYSSEKKLLSQLNNNGLGKGLVVGALTFAFLRGGPGILRRVISKSATNGYKFDNVNPSIMAGSQTSNPRPGVLFRSVRFGLDCFVSLSMATYGSMYFLDMKKMTETASCIPLVEGRSMISDELCDDFIGIYYSIHQKTWEKYEGKSIPLDRISSFVKNCMKRKVIETQLLEQQRGFGVADNSGHVEIPSPGVPVDTNIEINWNTIDSDVKKNNFEWDGEIDTIYDYNQNNDNPSLTSLPSSDEIESDFHDSEFLDHPEEENDPKHYNKERRWN